jgi:mono/diheme cytochrome c family protein
MRGLLLALAAVLASSAAHSLEINPDRARFHYQMHCQGCHAPDGAGASHVPRMKDMVGNFLRTPEGREYLVRVPGSAISALDDEELAEVLNWILQEMAGASLPENYARYTAQEVGKLRRNPLNEVVAHRGRLLTDISRTLGE